MHFTSLNINIFFVTQGDDALDHCQGLCPWTLYTIIAGLDPTRGFLRFALNISPSKQFLNVGSPGFGGGAHPPSDTFLSTQARNVVLVLHFGHCLYSTPPPGEKQSWICLCLSFVPFMLGLIKENVCTKYDLRKFVIFSGVCIKIRTCRSE